MDRKYRQRGYMESEREEQRSRPRAPRQDLTPEERIQRKSMRHAIDRQAHEVLRCHDCGRNVFDLDSVGPDAACPHCRAALHCCRACQNFDVAARWQCRAPIEEAVGDKNKANRCGLYQPRLVLDATGRRSNGRAGGGRGDDPRSAFESLFKR